MSIGQDLLDVPFAELIRNMAIAIADGQTAMDRNSLETVRALAEETIDVLTDVTEVISPNPISVPVSGGDPVEVTGATVTQAQVGHAEMTLLQAGLFPTFYQFTDAEVRVRLSISMRRDDTSGRSGGSSGHSSSASGFLGLGNSRAYASSVDYRTQNTYSYNATGCSELRATLKPVPPPSRLRPTLTTINTFSTPPTITTA